MHPCSGEMQGLNSNSLLDLSNSSDDFLRQILSSLPSSSWPLNDHNVLFPYPDPNSNNLTSKFQNHQISDITDTDPPPFLPIPLHPSPSPVATATDLYNGSLQPPLQHSNSNHHLQPPHQGQSFGASAPSGGGAAAASVQPKQKARARRGQATDPHSIAERLRRERIAERMKALQELVPNANKTDKASMLDEIIDYVKFLQLQVKVLSMSRLGGAAAVAPMVADASSEGGDDCVQGGRNGNEKCSNDTLAMTEQQVAKLMEEDMGSAMQYLQGKGLCLMPISLATAISTATCHTRNPLMNHPNGGGGDVNVPSSPGISALTVQSTTMGNGGVEPSSVSVSKS